MNTCSLSCIQCTDFLIRKMTQNIYNVTTSRCALLHLHTHTLAQAQEILYAFPFPPSDLCLTLIFSDRLNYKWRKQARLLFKLYTFCLIFFICIGCSFHYVFICWLLFAHRCVLCPRQTWQQQIYIYICVYIYRIAKRHSSWNSYEFSSCCLSFVLLSFYADGLKIKFLVKQWNNTPSSFAPCNLFNVCHIFFHAISFILTIWLKCFLLFLSLSRRVLFICSLLYRLVAEICE